MTFNRIIALILVGSSMSTAWRIISHDVSVAKAVISPQAAPSVKLAAAKNSDLDGRLNSIEVLLSKRENSELFANALAEVQSLKKSNSCHRTAARVFLDSCQYLEEFAASDVINPQSQDKDHIVDYMYSYALSLSMCDLGAARQRAPMSCQYFHESTLQNLPTQDGTHALHVSHQQVHNCMEDLYSDVNFWTSFTNNKAKATLFCQLARLDIEQDMALVRLEQSLIAVSKAMDGLESQLERSKLEHARQEEVMTSYFDGISKIYDKLKHDITATIYSTRSGLKDYAQDVQDSFVSFGNQVNDCRQALATFGQTILETHAEHASAQAQVIEEATDLAMSIRRSNIEVAGFQSNMDMMSANLVALANSLAIMQQRQDLIDAQSSYTLRLIKNITDQLQSVMEVSGDHSLVLTKAHEIASGLLVNLEEAKSTASSYARSSIPDIIHLCVSSLIVAAFPFMAVKLGSHGLEPSLTRNVVLAISGLIVYTAFMLISPILLFKWNTHPRIAFESSNNASYPTILTTPVTSRVLASPVLHSTSGGNRI